MASTKLQHVSINYSKAACDFQTWAGRIVPKAPFIKFRQEIEFHANLPNS